MPTYEYLCAEGHAFERFQKMSDRPVTTCPTCGAKASRKVSGGQGLIFKGSGFYITDYGKDGKGPRKAESSEAASSGAESKSSAKSTDASAVSPAPATPAKPAKGDA
ncbi:MAG TPA: FmdB family zinc ribbon protein [Gemmatimonadales bacterium]|nr:FmdB family zinc ribbon protein [Gemmatimonadales bacterium]